MRDITATVLPSGLVTVEGNAGFVEEHNAARLVVELNEEMTAQDISCHCFCFDIYGLGRKIVTNNIYGDESDAPAYRIENTLYCPLPADLTSTGELAVQIEAHKAVDGETRKIVKSAVFMLRFEPSVTGSVEALAESFGLLPRVQAVLAGIEMPGSRVTRCTAAEYAAMQAKDPAVFYLVDEEEAPPDETDDTIYVTGVTLNKATVSLSAGSTEVLTAAVLPSNASNKAVVWSSGNPAAATVTQAGVVTAVSAGSAVITAATADGGFTAACAVTVTASLPGLWQGTKTVNGITVTISGNTVTINGTKNTNDSSGGGGYLTENSVPLFTVPAAWHTFAGGTQLTLIVSNKTGTATCAAANAACVLRKTDNTILTGATWGSPTGTFTHTCSGSTPVYGLLFYMSAGETVTNYRFDAAFWVNGVRWI